MASPAPGTLILQALECSAVWLHRLLCCYRGARGSVARGGSCALLTQSDLLPLFLIHVMSLSGT